MKPSPFAITCNEMQKALEEMGKSFQRAGDSVWMTNIEIAKAFQGVLRGAARNNSAHVNIITRTGRVHSGGIAGPVWHSGDIIQ